MSAAPATRLCATTRKQGRNNAPGNTVQTARCANSWPSARPQHAQQLRARHVPALPHANQRCRTYSQQLIQVHTYRPRSPYCDGAQSSIWAKSQGMAGMRCWEPARRPMRQYTKRSQHSFTEAMFLQRQLAQRVC